MNAVDVMTRKLITAMPSMTLNEAVRLMLSHRISGLPVIDDHGAAVGMITEGDLLRRAETGTERQPSWWRAVLLGSERLAEQYVHTHARRVEEVMTRQVISVTPTTPLADVVAIMETRGVKRLLVLEGTRPVGIISRADLIRALEQLLAAGASSPATADTDAAVRRQILQQVERQRWAPGALIDVRVADGTAELRGYILSEGQRQALRVLAENTNGVKRVVDKLVWIEPYSGFALQLPDESDSRTTNDSLRRPDGSPGRL
jgi:CBS domain-containing protein